MQVLDKAEVVRNLLAVRQKALDESAFGNQVLIDNES